MRPAPPGARPRPFGVDAAVLRFPIPASVPGRLALLLAAAAGLLLPSLGSAPIERAEIYFLDGARGMVESGDWLVPRYRGEAFFDKPALAYWSMAASFRLFGFSLAAGRLVSVLAALGTIAATAWLGRRLLNDGAALLGSVVLATTAAFLSFGRLAMSDMLMTFFVTVAVASAAAPTPWTVPLLGLVLGLGFLTKGPVAVLFAVLGLAALLAVGRRLRFSAGVAAAGAAAFLAAGGVWFVLVQQRLGWGPLAHFFLRENLQRFAGATYDSHRQFWYYLPTYAVEALPWSLFLPFAARAAWRHPGGRALILWAAAMAVPLTLSRGKIDYYLLPLYPPLSLVIGYYFASVPWGDRDRGWSRVVVGAFAVAAVAAVFAVWRFPVPWRPATAMLTMASVAAVAGGIALVRVAYRPDAGRVLASLAATMGGLVLFAVAVFLPSFRAAQPNVRLAADVAREKAYVPDVHVALCEDPTRVDRDIVFHARLATQADCALWAPADSSFPFLLILSEPERASLRAVEALRDVGEYHYLPATALTLEGLLFPAPPQRLHLMANFATDEPVAMERWRRERRRDLAAQAAREAAEAEGQAAPAP